MPILNTFLLIVKQFKQPLPAICNWNVSIVFSSDLSSITAWKAHFSLREISSDTEVRFVLKLPVAQAVAKEVAFLAQTHRGEQPLNPSGHFVITLGNGAFKRARGEKGQGGVAAWRHLFPVCSLLRGQSRKCLLNVWKLRLLWSMCQISANNNFCSLTIKHVPVLLLFTWEPRAHDFVKGFPVVLNEECFCQAEECFCCWNSHLSEEECL